LTPTPPGPPGLQGRRQPRDGHHNSRAWGLEDRTIPERVAAAIDGGTDILSGLHDEQTITDLVRDGLLSAPGRRATDRAAHWITIVPRRSLLFGSL
jgi:hypothetical protein